MCSHDSCTHQRTPTGWLANVHSAIYKPQSHSNLCTQETVTTIWLVKVMQTGVETMMTEDQPLVVSSHWDSVGMQSPCKPRSSRRWLSSYDAEYQDLGAAVQEASFLRSLICDMGYQQMQATLNGEDNKNCIKLATNPVMHKRSKRIDTKYHFIREKIDDYSIQLVYTAIDQMAADLLTRSLPQVKVEQHLK